MLADFRELPARVTGVRARAKVAVVGNSVLERNGKTGEPRTGRTRGVYRNRPGKPSQSGPEAEWRRGDGKNPEKKNKIPRVSKNKTETTSTARVEGGQFFGQTTSRKHAARTRDGDGKRFAEATSVSKCGGRLNKLARGTLSDGVGSRGGECIGGGGSGGEGVRTNLGDCTRHRAARSRR